MVDPYSPPSNDASLVDPDLSRVSRWFWLPGFLSAIVLIPLLFIAFGIATGSRDQDFMAGPGFIATLAACSLGAALTLYPLRRSRWILHVFVAPVLAFVFFIAVVLVLHNVFT
jgi:hypothetical protein